MKRRNTKSKEKVLQFFKNEKIALSHEMIQSKLKSIDRATIYRILNRFHEDGIVHKVIGADGKGYFALTTTCGKDNHHHRHLHFQCKRCQKVECLKDEVMFSVPKGYQFQDFQGLVTGICNTCT